MTVISDYVLMSSFCVRPFTQYRERLECTFQCSAYVLLLINSLASFVEFVLFLMQKRIAVEHEKHEDGLQDKKGEAHDS